MTTRRDARSVDVPMRSKVGHRLRQLVAVVGSISLTVGIGWFASQERVWAWPTVVLPVAYLISAILYRIEDRLPGWASRFLELAAQRFGTISWLSKMETVRQTNAELLTDFNLTLQEYGLGEITDQQRRRIAARGKTLRIKDVARRVADQLPTKPNAKTIELLHRERCGFPTINLWQKEKERAEWIQDIAAVLIRSERLPLSAYGGVTTTTDDLEVLLPSLRDIDIDVVVRELRIVAELRDRLHRYVDFLELNGVATARGANWVTAGEVRERFGILPDGATTLFRLEDHNVVLDLVMDCDRRSTDRQRLVHAGVFLAERDTNAAPLIEHLCRAVTAEPEVVTMLHAYLWKKEQTRRSVPLRQLDDEWKAWAEDAAAELGAEEYDLQLSRLQRELETGRWPTTKLGSNYITVQIELAHDEVRDVDAYLITTDVTTGPVSDLINALNATPAQQPDLVAMGIELEYHGHPKYRFHDYTKNTHLGVVPRGMPFHDFYEDFVHDIDILLRNRTRALPGQRWLPRLADMRPVEQGQSRDIDLWETGAGPILFSITQAPSHGRLIDPPMPVDEHHAMVRYEAPIPGPMDPESGRYICDAFTYIATRSTGASTKHTVHLLAHPAGAASRPCGVKSVHYGAPQIITMRDDAKGPSTFVVIDPPQHGRLGNPQRKDDNHAIVTYLAQQSAYGTKDPVYDEFTYRATSATGHANDRTARLLVYPDGVVELSNFEITLERIDPGHCHELWFGDDELGSRARSPSVSDVWRNIEGKLDPIEHDDVKRVFDRIAGGVGV